MTALQDAVNALIMLQLNSIKTNVSSSLDTIIQINILKPLLFQVSEDDFAQIERTGFTKEQISVLWQFVTSKGDFVRNVLDQLSLVEYRFRDLEWRVEGRIASRSLIQQSTPFITIKFHLDSETVNENKCPLLTQSDQSNAGNTQRSRKKEVIFQTDPNNLLYIINVLEKTLQEARTHRVRNIVKNI